MASSFVQQSFFLDTDILKICSCVIVELNIPNGKTKKKYGNEDEKKNMNV